MTNYTLKERDAEEVQDCMLADREKSSFSAYQLAMSEPSASGNSADQSERDIVADDGLERVVRRSMPNFMPKNFPPVHQFREGSD